MTWKRERRWPATLPQPADGHEDARVGEHGRAIDGVASLLIEFVERLPWSFRPRSCTPEDEEIEDGPGWLVTKTASEDARLTMYVVDGVLLPSTMACIDLLGWLR
jgi:hypothetical protein